MVAVSIESRVDNNLDGAPLMAKKVLIVLFAHCINKNACKIDHRHTDFNSVYQSVQKH